LNVADLVRRAAQASPDRTALVAEERRLTWAEFDRAVDRCAAALSGGGLVAGYRVALALSDSIEFAVCYFGALRAGFVVVLVNPAGTAAEIADVLAATGTRVVLADATSVDAVRSAVREIAAARQGVIEPDGGGERASASGQARGDGQSSTSGQPNPGQPSRDQPNPGQQRVGGPGGVGADHDAELVPLVVPVGVPAVPGERAYDDLMATPARAPAVPPADPETLAVLSCTPGSGVKQRVAMLTHRALVAAVDQLSAVEPAPVRGEDVVLGAVPLCHVAGCNGVLATVARAGATLVVVRHDQPERALEMAATEKVTVVPVVPPVLAAWSRDAELANALASVRVLQSLGAPLPSRVRHDVEMATGLVVHDGYVLTEAAGLVTSTVAASGDASRKPGCLGVPVPGVEIRVVDDAGVDVEPGEPGQILVRSRSLFSGYWPDGSEDPGEEGWHATGDVGYLDEEGRLTLAGRSSEVVVVSGFNVYPREVEEVIAELDSVADVAVVGVPDPATGEAVVAYVVPRPGQTVTPQEVSAHCAARLARFRRPSVVRVVQELPRSVTGNVVRARLAAELSDRP
jgi:long-chain acyl-CoA synthetase